MKTEIRLAHVDCGEGREQDALARVNIVRRILRISKLWAGALIGGAGGAAAGGLTSPDQIDLGRWVWR